MKSIMYHYVREYNLDFPYFKYLDIKKFRQQLDFFDDKFGFVNKDEFINAIRDKAFIPKDKIILTFDDGLSDHYDFVYPELKKRGLWGIFYVPTLPLSKKAFLGVHKIHILTGCVEAEKLISQLDNLITDEMIADKKIESFRTETYKNQKNSEAIENFKRTMNYYINYKDREWVLNELLKINNLNIETKDFYLTVKQMKEMKKNGMLFGSHSESHPVFSKLAYKDQEREIVDSFNALDKVLNPMEAKTFCFPYGGFHSFNKDTIEILNANKCSFSFNVEPRDITLEDIISSPQTLPRYDCNLFKHGAIC